MKKIRSHAISVRRLVQLFRLGSFIVVGSLVILIGVIAHSSCQAATRTDVPSDQRAINLDQFIGGIVSRSARLNYISEQDSEVFAFYRNTQITEITGNVMLGLLRRPPETQISEESWSSFFRTRTNGDSTGRWKRLQEFLESNLTNVTVFRVLREAPHGAQYDLYAVGIFNGHTVVGVQMYGVAT